MLTVHILTMDNESTISRCLESIDGLDCRLVVGDMGSKDRTKDLCRDFGAEVVDVRPEGDFSVIRNSLCPSGKNMYLEPWERVARGAGLIGALEGNHAFYVAQAGTVSKQVRLWDRGRFENPIFETVSGSGAKVNPGVVVVSEGQPDTRERDTEMCRRWAERRPTSPDPHYYLACCMMAGGKFKEFMREANLYLSMGGDGGDSEVLMNYYMCRAEMATGKVEDAFRRALWCLASRPSYAEFWCLLGDMLCFRGDYARARHMYENARLAGSRRRSDDMFPIELRKYEAYPRVMEEKCSSALGEGLLVGGKASR